VIRWALALLRDAAGPALDGLALLREGARPRARVDPTLPPRRNHAATPVHEHAAALLWGGLGVDSEPLEAYVGELHTPQAAAVGLIRGFSAPDHGYALTVRGVPVWQVGRPE
jgi:hypothetical protein